MECRYPKLRWGMKYGVGFQFDLLSPLRGVWSMGVPSLA
jgi:hypothetical protein